MSFYISKLPPIFFNNKKINKTQNDFLMRMTKEQEIIFIEYFAAKVQRVINEKV